MNETILGLGDAASSEGQGRGDTNLRGDQENRVMIKFVVRHDAEREEVLRGVHDARARGVSNVHVADLAVAAQEL